jgi:ATP-dependent DNA ligase
MALPVRPPVEPMLSKAREDIPTDDGWRYEPKWDGFRAIVFKDGDDVRIASRDHRPLNRYFPEVEEALRESLPERCVVDGEVVVAGPDGRLEFDTLQLRLHPAESRVRKLAAEIPASFVAFDLLAQGDEDLRGTPLAERRRRLEAILDVEDRPPTGGTQVVLTPHTADPEEARVWFEAFAALGLDGIIAKRADLLYHPGERVMVKVKHRRTADCVVGGYRLSKAGDGVGSLLLGLYDEAGSLHFVGHTSSFKAAERREILAKLRALGEGESFGEGARQPGEPSRWSSGKDLSWYALPPVLVCEVAYDHMQGDRFRHGSTFLRWREDKRPEECRFEQVFPSRR